VYCGGWILFHSNPLLNRFAEKYPSSSLYDLASLKDFVKNMVYSINGIKDNLTAALDTIGQY